MAVNDMYAVVAQSTIGVQTAVNTWHYRIVSESAPGLTATGLAARWIVLFAAAYKAILCSAATYRGLTVQKVSGALPLFLPTPDVTAAGVGGVAGDALPTQSCGVVTWQSVLSGRRNRGRSYIPFPSETSNNATGQPTAAYITLMKTFADLNDAGWTVTLGAETYNMQLAIWRVARVVGPDLINNRCNVRWGTQRRRGDYGASNVSSV